MSLWTRATYIGKGDPAKPMPRLVRYFSAAIGLELCYLAAGQLWLCAALMSGSATAKARVEARSWSSRRGGLDGYKIHYSFLGPGEIRYEGYDLVGFDGYRTTRVGDQIDVAYSIRHPRANEFARQNLSHPIRIIGSLVLFLCGAAWSVVWFRMRGRM
ncbi:MAG: hypothetical protein HY077_03480 [Elusimicrobia bacterium]|nr:hypothetical protein [Elusimicrobiota bacterium]